MVRTAVRLAKMVATARLVDREWLQKLKGKRPNAEGL
jgi:hypothetical protein